jgi:hypothetical protein
MLENPGIACDFSKFRTNFNALQCVRSRDRHFTGLCEKGCQTETVCRIPFPKDTIGREILEVCSAQKDCLCENDKIAWKCEDYSYLVAGKPQREVRILDTEISGNGGQLPKQFGIHELGRCTIENTQFEN